MFPTHVGMNRRLDWTHEGGYYVPHTRGDEPKGTKPAPKPAENVPHTRGDEPRTPPSGRTLTKCSPHTWG